MRSALVVMLAAVALAAGCAGSSPSPRPAGGATEGSSPASPGPAASARARAASWTTYHADGARSGRDRTSPRVGRVRRAWSSRVLDGALYAEPLALGRRVYVASENDSVYALDARDGRVIWRRHVGTPIDGSTLPCGNIDPSGITSTPVIDRRAGRLYVLAFVRPFRHLLFGLDLGDGRVRSRRALDPPGGDPRVHQQRAALALSRGRVYVAYGGLYGDCGRYHGFVVAARTDGTGPLSSYRVPVGREGGIWTPSGPTIGRGGRLFVATGNGDSAGFDLGNSVIALSPGLRSLGYFRPRGGGSQNLSDTDLGSTGPALVSGGRLFQIGKSGDGFLLSAARLGGVGGELFRRHVCEAAFGGLAYSRPLLYIPCVDGLVAVRIGRSGFSVAWRQGFHAGPPILAGGLVWSLDLDDGTLRGFSRAGGRPRFDAGVGAPANFATPAAGGGRLFVAAGRRVVAFSGV